MNDDQRRHLEAAMKVTFGSLQPPVCRLPHCLFEPEREAIRSIVHELGVPVGVWGQEPRWASAGQYYVGTGEVEDFHLWGLPENQEFAVTEGWFRLPCMALVVPLSTPTAVLQEMYDDLSLPGRSADFYDCIGPLAAWMERIEWALLALEYEATFAMFVTRPDLGHFVDRIDYALSQVKVKHSFRIEWNNGNCIWTGSPYIDPDAI